MSHSLGSAHSSCEPIHLRGGGFLLGDAAPGEVFTPEDFTPEQLMYAKTARDFIENEVIPASDEIENKNMEVHLALFRKAGQLGLLMADVPEAHGGLGLDKASSALIAESISGQGSFQVTFVNHVGIGTLPIVYYGTPEQKARYLPGLADGSLLGCYGLTEPTAGSDALASRTRAVLSADGSHYVLNGTKQFITTSKYADVMTVFAKVEGEHFTAFLLEKGMPGLSTGPEEHKMGIRGTSTATVILDDVKVPVANVLGEVGKGHKIAFNILNLGRFKLGAIAVGAAKRALGHALAYTLERKQFGQRICEFGAIREKLAEMLVRIYAAESASYRTIGLIDRALRVSGDAYGEAALRGLEEYSIECSMVKVLGSEALDYVVDETVQCYGGYGYCSEYPAEAFYRDSRINRIFEGTNEINRIIVPTMLLRKAAAGEVPLLDAAWGLGETAGAVQASGRDPEGGLEAEKRLVANLKKLCVLVLGTAAQKYGKRIAAEQAVLLRIADLAMAAFQAESTVLRALKETAKRGEAAAAVPTAVARIVCEDSVDRAESLARQALVAMDARSRLPDVANLAARDSADIVALRESIAARLVEMERVVT